MHIQIDIFRMSSEFPAVDLRLGFAHPGLGLCQSGLASPCSYKFNGESPFRRWFGREKPKEPKTPLGGVHNLETCPAFPPGCAFLNLGVVEPEVPKANPNVGRPRLQGGWALAISHHVQGIVG